MKANSKFPLLTLPVAKPIFPGSSLVLSLPSNFSKICSDNGIEKIGLFPIVNGNELGFRDFDERELTMADSKLPMRIPHENKANGILETLLSTSPPQNIQYGTNPPSPTAIPFAPFSFYNGVGTLCNCVFARDGRSSMAVLMGISRISLHEHLYGECLHTAMVTQLTDNGAVSTEILKSVLEVYRRLEKLIPVNLVNLEHANSPASIIDLLLGFLATTSSVSVDRLIELLNELRIDVRAEEALELLLALEESTKVSLEIISRESISKPSSALAQDGANEIYEFLKRGRPNSSPTLDRLNQLFITKRSTLPPNLISAVSSELDELAELGAHHPEFSSKVNFLEILLDLPFGLTTNDKFDLEEAKAILDSEHFGMEEVKERILEFLAIGKLRGSLKGKTILLDGPPGVGKTSIASSIAKCLGRKFTRISLGGESDVAIIKGHRRTYVGAFPGKIVQALRSTGSSNPVILLDEIDKVGRGLRGSIYDVLLEILDPSQNSAFSDHFLDFPIDLSNILFLASSNLSENIPAPLLDRMEFISLSGYSMSEKLEIGKRHLIPGIKVSTGIGDRLVISDEGIKAIILGYARESGMRGLQKSLLRIAEKASLRLLVESNSSQPVVITPQNVREWLGKPKFGERRLYESMLPGISAGLGFNQYGGSVLFIEAVESSAVAEGSIKLTGSLGPVMVESVQIAYSLAKMLESRDFQINTLESIGVHLHFPAGSTPKDGPSAGIAITTALLSLARNKCIPEGIAMTGEVTLTGKVLEVGGVKEKVLAAKREGFTKVILPKGCEIEVEGMKMVYVERYEEVMREVFFNEVSSGIEEIPINSISRI